MSQPKPPGAGHNGGPPLLTPREWLEIIGPREPEAPAAFQSGAPWTGYATDDELIRVARLQARIERRERAIASLREERTRIMMRCVRRMRRETGKE